MDLDIDISESVVPRSRSRPIPSPTTFETYVIEYEENEKSDCEYECSICYESFQMEQFAKIDCNHMFCLNCTRQLLNKREVSCALCRCKFQTIKVFDENIVF